MPPPPPQFMGMPPGPPPMPMRPPPQSNKREHELDDMSAKKGRMDSSEANLIPEQMFLRTNPNPVTFTVHIPEMPDKAEWKLDGKPINLTLPLTDQVWSHFYCWLVTVAYV